MKGTKQTLMVFFIVVATIVTVLFTAQPVFGQETPPPETYLFMEAPVFMAKDLPEVSQGQCQDFKWHLLGDHPERLQMAQAVLELIASGSLVASQVRTNGTRAIAVVQTKEYGRVVLIWGPGVIPTTFSAAQSWINRELKYGKKVDATSTYAKRVLAEVAKAFRCMLPEAVPQPEPVPANEPLPAPVPKAKRAFDFQPTPGLIFVVMLLLVLGTAASIMTSRRTA